MEGINYVKKELKSLKRISNEEINKLYTEDGVCSDKFERKLEELKKKKEEVRQSPEDRLYVGIFGSEEEKEELEKKEKEYSNLFVKIIEYEEWVEKEKLKDIGNGLTSTRKYPSLGSRNKVIEGSLYLCEIYARKYTNVFKDTEYDDIFQTACLGLQNAAKYYIPSDIAKFSTYASRCIENYILKTYSKKKSKIDEEEILIKLKIALDYLSLIEYNNVYKVISKSSKINKALNLAGLHEYQIDIHSLNKDNNEKVLWELFTKVYNSIARKTSIARCISDDERNLISFELSRKKIPKERKKYETTKSIIRLYMKKIANYIIYNKAIEELKEKDIPITDDNIIKRANVIISKKRKEYNLIKRIRLENKDTPFWLEYEGELYKSFNGIVLNGTTSPANLQDKYESSFIDSYFNESLSAILFESYRPIYITENPYNLLKNDYEDGFPRIEANFLDFFDELEDMIEEYNNLDDEIYVGDNDVAFNSSSSKEEICNYIKNMIDRNHELFNDFIRYTDKSSYEIYKNINSNSNKKQEIKQYIKLYKSLKAYIDKWEDEEAVKTDYVTKRYEDNKKEIRDKYKPLIDKIHEENRKLYQICLFNIIGIRKWEQTTLDEIKEFINIQVEYNSELIEKHVERKTKDVKRSLDDEVITTLFIDDYSKALSELTSIERKVLSLYIDENGIKSYTPKEIANELGITTKEVNNIKTKALRKIRNNPIMQKYKKDFID